MERAPSPYPRPEAEGAWKGSVSMGPSPREPRLSCGTPEYRLTVAPFRAWRGWASRVAQGRGPRAGDPGSSLPQSPALSPFQREVLQHPAEGHVQPPRRFGLERSRDALRPFPVVPGDLDLDVVPAGLHLDHVVGDALAQRESDDLLRDAPRDPLLLRELAVHPDAEGDAPQGMLEIDGELGGLL